MTQPTQTTVQCPNCRTPNPVVIRRVVDAQRDPQGKGLLVNGTLNSFRCQNCGTVNTISSPVLYHDAAKELLIAFVPMDVAMRQGQQEEKIVGDLMNELTRTVPKEQFRAYMFNPKRALTMKGLIEQIMEADGITPAMIEAQKQRVELLQNMIEAGSEEALVELIHQRDAEIDAQFFQTVSLMAQRLLQNGQQQLVQHLAAIQQIMLEETTYGQEILAQQDAQEEKMREVAESLESFGADIKRDNVLDLAISYADDDGKLQALVSLTRPAMDYDFFTLLTNRIDQASGEDREKMEKVRDTLQQLIELVDNQSRALIQQKVQFLQVLISSPEYEALIQENIDMIDDNFMNILAANIQEAERRQDAQAGAKLRSIYEVIVGMLQSQMTPELRFLNHLLSTEDDQQLNQLIQDNLGNLSPEIYEVIDAVERLLVAQGQDAAIQRLAVIRSAIQQALN